MSETRYAQVARDLTEKIENGRYPVGGLLPTEMALCELYGASRHTIRAAIRELQELGIVSRRKKAGTRVEAPSPSAASYQQSLASVEDLIQFGVAHTRVVKSIGEITADRALAKDLECAVGRTWLRVSSLRMSADMAVGWTDVYVDTSYSDVGGIIRDKPELLISSLIESRYGRRIAEIRQDVRAVLLTPGLAKKLDADAGQAALRVVRRYLDHAGDAFEVSITVHPADRFTFSMRLHRN